MSKELKKRPPTVSTVKSQPEVFTAKVACGKSDSRNLHQPWWIQQTCCKLLKSCNRAVKPASCSKSVAFLAVYMTWATVGTSSFWLNTSCAQSILYSSVYSGKIRLQKSCEEHRRVRNSVKIVFLGKIWQKSTFFNWINPHPLIVKTIEVPALYLKYITGRKKLRLQLARENRFKPFHEQETFFSKI